MNDYELIVLLNTKEDQQANIEAIRTLLKERGTVCQHEEDMGDRPLAYLVGGEDRGHYYRFEMQLESKNVAGLEESLRLQPHLLRHLCVMRKMTKTEE